MAGWAPSRLAQAAAKGKATGKGACSFRSFKRLRRVKHRICGLPGCPWSRIVLVLA